ncbi:DUF885 domain-containing protein [Chitinophaga caeni]|uniref:DUF885 domain-containing protein n=1 Tax=Chitinophaga caeni TaxID=2029983 RepID=A0A291QQ52_9BACT|nr:DUF885 domain-containing protein [Chitinophaga caeni]ATL46023.1 DUF885 domain-containing protein [Chitinophaga caeni]
MYLKLRYPVLLLGLVFQACQPKSTPAESTGASAELQKLLDQYYEEKVKLFPVDATFNSDDRYNDQLTLDISAGFREKLDSIYAVYQQKLETIDTTGCTDNDKLSYEVLQRELSTGREGLTFHDNLMPVQQFTGLILSFPQLGSGSSAQPFKTVQDYDNFISRMRLFQVWVDTAIANMQTGMKTGYVQPRALVVKTIPQLKSLATKDSASNIFYAPLASLPSKLDDDEKMALAKRYKEAIETYVVPAYGKLADFLQHDYLPAARKSSGIEDVPGGKAYYKFLIKYWTTTDQSPDEIFATGQQEVARIRSEMEKVKNQVGYRDDLSSFFQFIKTDPQFKIFETPGAIIDSFKSIEHKIMPKVKEMYGRIPKTPFEVRQTEAFRAASASAEYIQGSADGSRPGIFYVPILNAKEFSYTGMECLFLHEAIPGHHFQISLQQENTNLPKIRRFSWIGAYGEGYALYCEGLGKDLGLYTNPYMYFGRLTDEMHRAIRLVVDVGMHHKGWTREQAIFYMMQNEPISEQEATAEIERYMAIPAQALSYKIGELKILELKHKYQQMLGDKFSIAAFHDALLLDGCLPLSVLERKMDKWADGQNR